MLGLFKSPKEKALGLESFSKWGKKIHASRRNPQIMFMTSAQMLARFSELDTPEQKLYAAYTSLDSSLMDSVKQELTLIADDERREALRIIYDVLEGQGKHGCSSLLKGHYKNDLGN